MRRPVEIISPLSAETCAGLSAGDRVFLSGWVYTGRDAAHARLYEAIAAGQRLPIELKDEIIFYAAPTPARPGRVIGSIGPTTGSRMDAFTPRLLEAGLRGMIGKGKRSAEVIDAIVKYGAVYLGAIGGVAALTSRCIGEAQIAAYEDLGPEAIMRLKLIRLPLVVINDIRGGDVYRDAVSNSD